MADRRDPLTRKELFEQLSHKVCIITYGTPRRTVKCTLMHEWIKELDNFPIGFETTYEAAMFDLHSVNCLDIDNNQWITIEVNSIRTIIVP